MPENAATYRRRVIDGFHWTGIAAGYYLRQCKLTLVDETKSLLLLPISLRTPEKIKFDCAYPPLPCLPPVQILLFFIRVEDLETSQAELERRLDCSGPMAQQQRIQSIRAELCRTIDRMRAAEDALEVALTCLNCTKLLRNPQLMVPCGHTLCGDCCYRSSGEEQCDKREELELVSTPPEWSAGAGTTSREERVHTQGVGTACCLCRKEWNGKGGESRPEASREGTMMAPNRAVAAMVGKFMFRRHCLEALKLIGQALWKEGDKEEKSTA